MTDKIFYYVRHHEVPSYEQLGWVRLPSLEGTHHGAWSTLMEWRGEGMAVKPLRISYETEKEIGA